MTFTFHAALSLNISGCCISEVWRKAQVTASKGCVDIYGYIPCGDAVVVAAVISASYHAE